MLPRSIVRRMSAFLLFVAALLPLTAHAADPSKVLRIYSPDITSLDPQQGTDLYSTRVATAIFEALYEFDYLTEPAKAIPCTAAAMPAITDGGKTWTIKLKPGIRFADAPAFKGKPRESTEEGGGGSSPRTTCTRSSARSTRICCAAATPRSPISSKACGRSSMPRASRARKSNYDAPVERAARARSLYAADPAHERQLHAAGVARGAQRDGGRARSGRGRRRRHQEPAGRHRTLRAQGMEASHARRPRGQSALPRRSSSRRAPSRATAPSSSRCAARVCRRSAASKSASSRSRRPYLLAFQQGDLDYIELGGSDIATRARR